MDFSMPESPVLHHLPDFAQIHVHWVGDVIQPSHLCYPLLLLPSIFPSTRVFSDELLLHIKWPKCWSFSMSPSNEYLRLISFWIDWFDFLWDWLVWSPCSPRDSKESSPAPQFESINSSASVLLMVLLSHPYITTGKTIALTIWTLAGKVMSLPFYYNELAHAIMKAHKSQDVQLASWRPKRAESTAPVQVRAGSRLRKRVLVWVQRQE